MDLEGVTEAVYHAGALFIISGPEAEPPCTTYEDVRESAEVHNALERSA